MQKGHVILEIQKGYIITFDTVHAIRRLHLAEENKRFSVVNYGALGDIFLVNLSLFVLCCLTVLNIHAYKFENFNN
jgi:hypothetical protein